MADTSGTCASTGTAGSSMTAATATRVPGGGLDRSGISVSTGRTPGRYRDGAGCASIGGTDCFLDDVRIATPAGDMRVQDLREGDIVCVRERGATMARPVVRIGSRTVHLERTASLDDHPVRVRAGAFACNIPGRDLLVTSDHCIHVDGLLVPARMLVNGATIVADTGITNFTCHHLELAQHGVLIAEGLEVESHLDAHDRMILTDGLPALLRSSVIDGSDADRAVAAVAPLAADRATVEPIWTRLATRAETLQPTVRATTGMVDEAAVRLVGDDGIAIEPVLFDGSVYGFVVPGHVTRVRLTSRAACRTEAGGPFVDDRRMLGVRVGRIGTSQDGRRVATEAHLRMDELPGWHALDCPDGRWTDGNALLPIDAPVSNGAPMLVDIEVLSAGPYALGSGVTGAVLTA